MRRPTHALHLSWISVLLGTFASPADQHPWESLVLDYCVDCHDSATAKGEVDLESALDLPLTRSAPVWERALRQVGSHLMPPTGEDRPDRKEHAGMVHALATNLDEHARKHPDAGRTATMRRLTRYEYQNAIRDLLDLRIDPADFLPPDPESHGFDNVTVGDLPPGLLVRYLDAAQEIARIALGRIESTPGGRTVRVPPDLTQDGHLDGFPLGTRGGVAFQHAFPRDGEYDIRIHLMRDRDEMVEGLNESHELQVLLDHEVAATFQVKPPRNRRDHNDVDAHLAKRLKIPAGTRVLAVTFVAPPPRIVETLRQPYQSAFNKHRHPRRYPAVYQVTITGPYAAAPPSLTPSRFRVLGRPEEAPTGRQNIERLTRLAFRGRVTEEDIDRLMEIFREVESIDGFEAGMEASLAAILVSPKFLFRVEREPEDAPAASLYQLSGLDLASRLSFFLWSSLPDEELLRVAETGALNSPEGRSRQVVRMLEHPQKAFALSKNFAGQWLYLRNLEAITPDGRLYPDFDHNLRTAMRRETELHFEAMRRRDRSILRLLSADYTYLNERLAEHYGIPHVSGDHFRHVDLPPDSTRGGILRHASILTVTSYATRTSPVLRGHWVLENILGTPPPPPPPDIPTLEDVEVDASLPVRERLAVHREKKSCARCHDPMDPVGFAFEHFDAVGKWRWREGEATIDARGKLPDGRSFEGIAGLERQLLADPRLFARTLTEKLLVYALGRGLEPSDAAAVREIVRKAEAEDYRFSALIEALVESPPFTMRMTAP